MSVVSNWNEAFSIHISNILNKHNHIHKFVGIIFFHGLSLLVLDLFFSQGGKCCSSVASQVVYADLLLKSYVCFLQLTSTMLHLLGLASAADHQLVHEFFVKVSINFFFLVY